MPTQPDEHNNLNVVVQRNNYNVAILLSLATVTRNELVWESSGGPLDVIWKPSGGSLGIHVGQSFGLFARSCGSRLKSSGWVNCGSYEALFGDHLVFIWES